jgi:hypothetical protein
MAKKINEEATKNAKPRRRYLPNIWQAIDKGDELEFYRHLKKIIPSGTLSLPFNNSVGLTILHSSVGRKETLFMFQALIEAGANPYVRNGSGEDVLAYARRLRVYNETQEEHAARVNEYAACIAKHEAATIAAILPTTPTPTRRQSGRL